MRFRSIKYSAEGIFIYSSKLASAELLLCPLSPIAVTSVAGKRMRERFLLLPIKIQYGVEDIIFYKTRISISTICHSTLKCITTEKRLFSFKLQSVFSEHFDKENVLLTSKFSSDGEAMQR